MATCGEGRYLVVWSLVVTFCILSAHCASESFREAREASGTRLSDSQKQNIQTFVRKLMDCYSVPGLTLAVVGEEDNDGQGGDDDHDENYWTYVDNFGKADMVKDIKVTNNTKFLLASVTKSFTSTLIAMLLEESNGSYTWDTPIRTILGDSFYLGDNYITNKVTLMDILSHRVGLARHDYLWVLGFITERKEMIKRLHLIDIEADFRTKYLYNNMMYALAGAVAEKIGGQSWEALIREKIFKPLGMKSSTFLNEMAPDYDGLARAHYWMNNGSLERTDMALYQYIESVGAAGSIATTGDDMIQWLLFLLRGGKNSEGKALMTPKALFYTHKPRITKSNGGVASKPEYPASERYDTYGMGWFCGDYRGHDSVMHTGSFSGYETRVSLQKDPKIGIYTSMNGPMTEICQFLEALIHMYIADVVMLREPWLTEENVCSFPEPWEPSRYQRYPGSAFFVDKNIQSTRDLKDFAGTYANYVYGELEVWVNSSESRLEAATKSLSYSFAMYPNGADDEFWFIALGTPSFFHTSDVWTAGPPTPPTVKFTRNGGGKGKKVSQLQWQIDDLVVFKKDLDIRQLPKPDFSQGCTGASAALQQQMLYVLYGIFLREIVKSDLLLS